MTRRRHSESAIEPSPDSEPRPQTVIDWLVWLALWPIVTVAWLVAVPFVLLYVAVGGSPWRCSLGSDCGAATTPIDLTRPDEVLTNDRISPSPKIDSRDNARKRLRSPPTPGL